jgi:hypothetical protein
MVDQFGVTLHGYARPIGSYVRGDFHEPRHASSVPKELTPQVFLKLKISYEEELRLFVIFNVGV